MDHLMLRPSSRLVEAEWIAPRLGPFGDVSAIVPGGFAAYVRILHPAPGSNNEALRWADVAVMSGRTMHRLAQFHAISGSADAPEPGNLPGDLLRVLCSTLAEHTSTPESCWFCLWEGYGWLHDSDGKGTIVFTHTGVSEEPQATLADATEAESLPPAIRAAVLNRPGVHLPDRNYFLFEGPLEAATEFGWNLSRLFIPQSPNLFWPADHAWCVASEIDLFCTLVGGSNALIESLIANRRLEAWRVFADDPVTSDSDDVNLT